MNLLIAYDVSQDGLKGQRRLRRVARICTAYGQRVQYSVFECDVTRAQMEELESRLNKEIDPKKDSLRVYVLSSDRDRVVHVFGIDKWIDFKGPLIL